MQRRFFIIVPALALLGACGGGGDGNGGPPPVVTATATPSSSPATGTVIFTIGPGQTIQSRRRQYVSSHTLSVVVTYGTQKYDVDFIQGSSGCTGAVPSLVCSVQFAAPAGSDTFTIAAYDQYGGRGGLLSQAQVTVNVAAGVNNVKAVLDGVPASASVPRAVNLPEAVATSVPVTITAYDADGAAIVGPGNYTAPIPVGDTDTSGTTTVSPSVSGPDTPALVTYNGTSNLPANAFIFAQFGGLTTQNTGDGLLRIVPQYAQYNTTSGQGTEDITAAPDGTLWAIEGGNPFGESMKLLHISANGTANEISLSSSLGQGFPSMVVGSDGALWCLSSPMWGGATGILRLDAGGNSKLYTNPNLSLYMGSGIGLVAGPDGRVWFVNHGSAGAIDMSGNFTLYPSPTTPSGLTASFVDITVGPDANLWATDNAQGGIVRITPSGSMTYFLTPGVTPMRIATYGNSLVVSSTGTNMLTLYQFDTSGNQQKTYTLPNFMSAGMTLASNGSLWIPVGTDIAGGSVIARVSAAGTVSTVSIPYPNDPGNGSPQITGLASATDGSMWYVRDTTYGRITVH
jgi:streptogramin lyase